MPCPATHEVVDHVASIVSRTIDETGVAAMLKVLPYNVKTWYRSDTALLTDRAVWCQDGDVQPRVVWAVAGRDDHRSEMLSGQVEPRHRIGDAERIGSDTRQDFAAQAGLVDVSVDGIEEAMHPPIGFGHMFGEIGLE